MASIGVSVSVNERLNCSNCLRKDTEKSPQSEHFTLSLNGISAVELGESRKWRPLAYFRDTQWQNS